MTTATLPAQPTQSNLETITGALANVYPQFKPETIQQADERSIARQTNEALRDVYGWTANVAVYRLENNEAVLYFGGRDAFNAVIGNNLAKATSQLISKENYTPTKDEVDIDAVVKSSLKIKIADLNLQRHNDEFGYFEIDTSDVNAERLNASQKAFAEKVYGSLEEKTDEKTQEKYTDFGRTMDMLRTSRNKIKTTRIYALNLGYVKSMVSDEEPVLARACWLNSFSSSSNFLADYWDVGINFGSLRGVRVAGGDAPKALKETEQKSVGPSYNEALKVVLGQPAKDEKTAAAFLRQANDFYQTKAQAKQ